MFTVSDIKSRPRDSLSSNIAMLPLWQNLLNALFELLFYSDEPDYFVISS